MNASLRARISAWLPVLALLWPGVAGASWYHVEVIVFATIEPIAVGGERWPLDPGIPDAARSLNLIEALPAFEDEPEGYAPAAGETDALVNPVAFLRLPPEQERLGAVADRLGRSRNYHVLAHLAWRQPGGGAGGRAVRIGSAPATQDYTGAAPAGGGERSTAAAPGDALIEGTVRLRVGGTLHIDTDLLYKGVDPPVRLTESRVVKLGELHYLDHPLFGVIVQVTLFRPDAGSESGAGVQDGTGGADGVAAAPAGAE
ncbi:MAG: hypothetical protein IT495_11570 [Gammaproteobacteria bacterium]|nr:hypothetical protein [Gammaproteobacteria bacterium]